MARPNLYHNEFSEITIHTAKCDWCNENNGDIIRQCRTCGLNFCTPCWNKRGEDGTHITNSGDRGYAATVAQRSKAQNKLKPKPSKVEKNKSPSPLPRRRHIRRRRVVIEESEDEEMDGVEQPSEQTNVASSERQSRPDSAPSERRRGKLPDLHIDEPASPSTRGPSNQITPANLSDRSFGRDSDTVEAADSLLALAAGPDSPKSDPGMNPLGEDSIDESSTTTVSHNTHTHEKQTSSTTTTTTTTKTRFSLLPTPSAPDNIIHQEALRRSPLFLPPSRQTAGPPTIPNRSAYAPLNTAWHSTPDSSAAPLLSSAYPDTAYTTYDGYLENQVQWPVTAMGEMQTADEIDGGFFSPQAERAVYEEGLNSAPLLAARRGGERGWSNGMGEEEEVEEGEIREEGGSGDRAGVEGKGA